MRWAGQQLEDDGALPGMPALKGLVRSVQTPEFAGITFHEVRARSVLNRVPGGSPMPFSWTVNPYRGCSHACTYCTVGSTPILRADGGSVPMSDLQVGDAVVGTVVEGGVRRLVRTHVLAHWSSRRPVVRVRLADGTAVVVGVDHRLLTRTGWRHVARAAADGHGGTWMVPGDVLLGAETLPAPGLAGVRDELDESRGADRTLVAVEPMGEETVYDVTTTTGDYVAEGLVHHNCFARNTHTYLDLDAGADFDRQVVVKLNAPEVLAREVRSARWTREHVAMGTNTDPYQRAEGRYRLMPGIIRALGTSGTPLSILTKGTLLARDLPDIVAAGRDVPVGVGVSLALLDPDLHRSVEPGTPTPRARLDLVRRISDAGLPVGVFVAPVLPGLTDSDEALDALLGEIAAAGAAGASVLALHLRPGTREWFHGWLAREHPSLLDRYAELYRRGAYVQKAYRDDLARRVAVLLRRHGLDGGGHHMGGRLDGGRGVREDNPEPWPDGALPRVPTRLVEEAPAEQLSLL
ncbi:Rv2578c family radical SAM protein [Actinomycetospora termitidis]|uniref:Rv2578c family radical SAM protein n=1 Tax=Actinomycetospora termitidis TaxID=3053470 RepID=A0ABT7MBC1_9PSEU|nr:Rv2578c family radical SAM protein [Actinomycetospora sp. Odt1-22]MDL5157957.1 Rv2578c family radical SAM protein [Actinomycetospora sp. Odt1-22]